jgi:hypothetical protein
VFPVAARGVDGLLVLFCCHSARDSVRGDLLGEGGSLVAGSHHVHPVRQNTIPLGVHVVSRTVRTVGVSMRLSCAAHNAVRAAESESCFCDPRRNDPLPFSQLTCVPCVRVGRPFSQAVRLPTLLRREHVSDVLAHQGWRLRFPQPRVGRGVPRWYVACTVRQGARL